MYVLENLRWQFPLFHFFIILMKLFNEFASLYCSANFAQREGAS